ncbi:MAG: SDR family NAD(P)-dependent oxidoreductase, partial [Candidatus Borkfalkiaceae bacterium]|nr:SDR family NAD(P)-dependent oxidoreductase [Clostridia bacterium]MDY6222873.1 SDR family NAD(P)-dependent oxidoreductase [Christensenellaceae bacterium]
MKNVALITGATGGLGREFVDLFARDGYNLLLTGRNEKKLSLIKKEAESTYGITAEVFPCDLAKSGAAEKIYSFAGEKQAEVTALVNNAG